jgi:hypothetical protein
MDLDEMAFDTCAYIFLQVDMCSYGIDYAGPPSVTSDICVEIPNTDQLSDLQIFQLNNILDQESDCFGVDQFQQALQVLQ